MPDLRAPVQVGGAHCRRSVRVPSVRRRGRTGDQTARHAGADPPAPEVLLVTRLGDQHIWLVSDWRNSADEPQALAAFTSLEKATAYIDALSHSAKGRRRPSRSLSVDVLPLDPVRKRGDDS